jgi:hypothetical protein
MKLEFYQHILKNPQIPNTMKIHPVGAELFHAEDGRTDTLFAIFANVPKKETTALQRLHRVDVSCHAQLGKIS